MTSLVWQRLILSAISVFIFLIIRKRWKLINTFFIPCLLISIQVFNETSRQRTVPVGFILLTQQTEPEKKTNETELRLKWSLGIEYPIAFYLLWHFDALYRSLPLVPPSFVQLPVVIKDVYCWTLLAISEGVFRSTCDHLCSYINHGMFPNWEIEKWTQVLTGKFLFKFVPINA